VPTPIDISASTGAKILNVSQWGNSLNAFLEIMERREPGYCERKGYTPPENDYNLAMQFGHAFEDAICSIVERVHGDRIINREKLYTRDYLTCHPDGEFETERAGIENKVTNIYSFRDNWGEPGSGAVAMDTQIQVQHQMILTGWKLVYVNVLVLPCRVDDWEKLGWTVEKDVYNGGYYLRNVNIWKTISASEWATTLHQMGFLHTYKVEADPELQERMIAEYRKFWETNILADVPPLVEDYESIKKLLAHPAGHVIVGNHVEKMVKEIKDITHEIGPSGPNAKRKDVLKARIMKEAIRARKVKDEDAKTKIVLFNDCGQKLGTIGKNGVLKLNKK
jgi:predicted phage-related endonuclease